MTNLNKHTPSIFGQVVSNKVKHLIVIELILRDGSHRRYEYDQICDPLNSNGFETWLAECLGSTHDKVGRSLILTSSARWYQDEAVFMGAHPIPQVFINEFTTQPIMYVD